MPGSKAHSALSSVDWNELVAQFLAVPGNGARFEEPSKKIAVWAKQLETCDVGNVSLPFIRQMQTSAQQVLALGALALYQPAAASIRSSVESALYYSYFRTHGEELATLVRSSEFYVSKNEVIAFHKTHTRDFSSKQHALGWLSNFETWYSEVSAILHGQLPGSWQKATSLASIKYDETTLVSLAEQYRRGVDIAHTFLLITVAVPLWGDFSASAKGELLKGMSGGDKKIIGLAAA